MFEWTRLNAIFAIVKKISPMDHFFATARPGAIGKWHIKSWLSPFVISWSYWKLFWTLDVHLLSVLINLDTSQRSVLMVGNRLWLKKVWRQNLLKVYMSQWQWIYVRISKKNHKMYLHNFSWTKKHMLWRLQV